MKHNCTSKDNVNHPKSFIHEQPLPNFAISGHGKLSKIYGLNPLNLSKSVLLNSNSKSTTNCKREPRSISKQSTLASDIAKRTSKSKHFSFVNRTSSSARKFTKKLRENEDEDELKKHHSVDLDQLEKLQQQAADELDGLENVSNGNNVRRRKIAQQKKAEMCVTENCRVRSKSTSEDDELIHLLGAERENEIQRGARVDNCQNIDGIPKKKEYKKSLFMAIYDQSVKLRRVRRELAKPAPDKKSAKMNKTSHLRQRFVHKQKILSTHAAAHLKKFKRLPFKTIASYGHACHDPPSHNIKGVKLERQINTAKEKLKDQAKVKII